MYRFNHKERHYHHGEMPHDEWLKDPRNIFHILAKLYRERFMSIIKEAELFPRQIPFLLTINSLNGCTQKELAIIFKYKPASITDALKRLEKSELIERKQDENDLRIVRVYITEKGKEQLQKSIEIQERLEEICYEDFLEEEKNQFIFLATKIIKNLDKEEMTEC